jgi:hypothetical protein
MSKMLAEFDWEPSVTAAQIGVTANARVVTLSGHVESYARKLAAETAARRVEGVKALAEEIEARLPFDVTRSPILACPNLCPLIFERGLNAAVPNGCHVVGGARNPHAE